MAEGQMTVQTIAMYGVLPTKEWQLGVQVLSLAIWVKYSDNTSSVDGKDTIAEEVVGPSH